MTTIWLNGWGLGESYLRSAARTDGTLEDSVFVPFAPDWEDRIRAADRPACRLIAYSSGAWGILRRPDLSLSFDEVVLFAPFLDLRSEAGLGGRVREAQLKYLLRWLRRDCRAAVQDFAARAGLRVGTNDFEGLEAETLVWGIEQLLTMEVTAETILPGRGYVGSRDPLLDSDQLSQRWGDLRVLQEAGHDLLELLKAAKRSP